MREFKKYRKVKYHRTVKETSKIKTFLIAILTLIIGSTYTFSYQVAKPYINWAKEGYTYSENFLKASAKVVPFEGGLVEEKSETVPLEEEAKEDNNSSLSQDKIKALISDYFGADAKIAYAVAKAESSLNPKAINKNTNGTFDCGIFQINSVHNPTKEQCENPEENIKLANKIYQKSGFKPWVTYNNQSYNKFLN